MKSLLLLVMTACTLVSCTQNGGNTPTVSKDITTPTFGSGKHMLEIYADYQCPACIWYNKNIVTPIIVKEFVDTNKLTLSYKQFPLQMHQNARGDALAALCAHAEGKFKEYKEDIYSLEEKKRGDDVSDAERIELAKTLGLNETTFTQCLKEQHYAKKIDADMVDGNKAGLQGTPTFILDGKMVDNKVFQDPASTRQFLQNVLK